MAFWVNIYGLYDPSHYSPLLGLRHLIMKQWQESVVYHAFQIPLPGALEYKRLGFSADKTNRQTIEVTPWVKVLTRLDDLSLVLRMPVTPTRGPLTSAYGPWHIHTNMHTHVHGRWIIK